MIAPVPPRRWQMPHCASKIFFLSARLDAEGSADCAAEVVGRTKRAAAGGLFGRGDANAAAATARQHAQNAAAHTAMKIAVCDLVRSGARWASGARRANWVNRTLTIRALTLLPRD